MQDTSFDYTLDERQRSMLNAMGIKVWLPDPTQNAEQTASPSPAAQSHTEATQKPIAAAISEPKQLLAGIETAQSASEFIANAPRSVATAPKATPQAALATTSKSPELTTTAISLSPRPEGIEQMDWQQLQTAVASCRACALCESRNNTVFGVGQAAADASQAPQADWLIVGEAPGENEDRLGEPFVGQSGKLLDNMLAAMKIGVSEDGKSTGLSRQKGVYIANVIKCRPPENRNPTTAEISMCEPYLARQIELLRPKMILAMGKFAISTVTGSNDPVGKLRGKVHKLNHPSYTAPVIVTYHPAYLLRNLPEKAKAWADLLLAMQTYRALPSSHAATANQQA